MAKATRRGWRGPGRAAQTRGLLAPARDPPLAVPTKTPLSARHTPADACMHPRCQSSQPPGGSFSPPPSSPGATEVPGHSATCPRSSNLEVKEWESELGQPDSRVPKMFPELSRLQPPPPTPPNPTPGRFRVTSTSELVFSWTEPGATSQGHGQPAPTVAPRLGQARGQKQLPALTPLVSDHPSTCLGPWPFPT